MKLRVAPTVILISGLALLGLSGARPPRIFIPAPEVILAQNSTTVAALALLDMDYEKGYSIYADALTRLPDERHHRRFEARALAHLGYWEEAATVLQEAGRDVKIRSAVDADAERMRALDAGRGPLAPGVGVWQRMSLQYGRNAGVGAVVAMEGGLLASAHPGFGYVTFWSPSGRALTTVKGVGALASLASSRGEIWAVDMRADRLIRISPERGITATIELGPLGVHGARSVAAAPDGSVWIADFGGGRAIRLSRDGAFITAVGGGRIEAPTAVLSAGTDVLVAESNRDRVLRYDANGRLLRTYVHPSLKGPVSLTSFPDGFLVQSRSGLVFWNANDREDLAGPLKLRDAGPLVTGPLGLASDVEGNLWWGDGASLHLARRLPIAMPLHLLEVLRSKAERGHGAEGRLVMTVSVLSRDGKPIDTLDARSFRLIRDQREMIPLKVDNLSRTLSGRRFTVVWESSDALLQHRASLLPAMEYFLGALGPDDQTSVISATDTFRQVRNFTVTPALLRSAFSAEHERVSAIDLAPEEPLANAILGLAPTDYARAIFWVTSGENFTSEMCRRLTRMGLVNQTPVFILHAGAVSEGLLRRLSERTHGRYFQLYGESSPAGIAEALETLRSGRYRITAALPLAMPVERGTWTDVTCEVAYLTETVFDKVGYYAY